MVGENQQFLRSYWYLRVPVHCHRGYNAVVHLLRAATASRCPRPKDEIRRFTMQIPDERLALFEQPPGDRLGGVTS
jgi:hypothetical protein